MRNWVCALLLVIGAIPLNALAQFAKIIDKDGYVNVRKSPDAKSKVVARIASGDYVHISSKGTEDANWRYCSYEKATAGVFSTYVSGYIHKSRLKQISDFPEIPAVRTDEKGAAFVCCGAEVEIKSGKFNAGENGKYFKKFAGYYTYKDKFALGVLGVFPPDTHYNSISGFAEANQFQIPKSQIENLFGVNNDAAACHYDKAHKTLFIVLNNADGADAYSALLIIEKGKYNVVINGDN